MKRLVPLAAACFSGCLAIPAASAAPREQPTSQEPGPRSAVVTSITEAITIDGVLDEASWRSAPKIGDLIQRQPAPGERPTERTDVTLLYNQDHLYVEYRFTRFRSNLLSTAAKRRLSGSINLTYGGYWSGKAEQITTSLIYKVPPRFTIGVSTNQTFARLPEGHFIARIFTATATTRRPRRCRCRIWFSTTTDPGTWAGRVGSAGRCNQATTCSSPSTRVDRGRRRHASFQDTGQQGIREVSVLVSLLARAKSPRQ